MSSDQVRGPSDLASGAVPPEPADRHDLGTCRVDAALAHERRLLWVSGGCLLLLYAGAVARSVFG